MPKLTLALACLLATFSHAQLTAQYQPQPAYIEIAGRDQLVNFDLIVHNHSKETWTVSMIQVSVLDKDRKLQVRKVLNNNGVRPSILTIPNREVKAGEDLLIFNPFFSFGREVQLATLAYELEFQSADQERTEKVKIEITPKPYPGTTSMRLPLGGRFIVWDGHDFYAHHRRWDYVFQPIKDFGFTTNSGRYSYDFIPVNEKGEMSSGPEEKNESWLGFGQPIFATGAGRVVAAIDSRPDDHRIDFEAMKKEQHAEFGNYIILDHGNGEFSLFGHIRQGSAKVRLGEHVKQGQQIAAIGASGSSLMPHLHYQVQTSASGTAEGLPSYFVNFYRILGNRKIKVAKGQVDSGDILKDAAK